MQASRTLGAGEAATLARVVIPAARSGLLAGGALAWGRALGEFGATLMFAGSFRGVTQTVPLAIYDQFATDFPGALALSAVLVCVSFALLLSVKLVTGARRSALLRVEAQVELGGFDLDAGARGRRRASASRWPGRRAPASRPCCGSSAGLLRPDRGLRALRRRRVAGHRRAGSNLAPERRRCGYVFQDYALFGHLRAWQNVAYGMRDVPRRRAARARASSC